MTWLDTSTGDPPRDGWYRFRGKSLGPYVRHVEDGIVDAHGIMIPWEKLTVARPLGYARYWPAPICFPEELCENISESDADQIIDGFAAIISMSDPQAEREKRADERVERLEAELAEARSELAAAALFLDGE